MDASVRVPGLEKLLDIAASGIGSVAGPMLASWTARREASAKLIAAQGEAEVLGVLADAQSKALLVSATAQADARAILASPDATVTGELDIAETVRQRIQFQEEKRQRNIEAVVAQAALEIGDKEVPDSETDHDWTARFFNGVQDVSSEGMQSLWAKVLAGEVERPGSTSIRTLGVLRDLDRPSAMIFRKLCSTAISFIPTGDTILDARVPSLGGEPGSNALRAYGLDFDALNVLNEHGLIISDYNSWFDYRLCLGIRLPEPGSTMRIPFRFQDRFWVLEPRPQRSKSGEFKVFGVALTHAGRELSRVVELEPMPEYRQALVSFFEKQNLRMAEVDSMQPHTVIH